jgi:3-oxoacyl-[acyl-carrier protein] reductase
MNENAFKNRVAIVTGAAEGIGYKIAQELCGYGAAVLLNDIDHERATTAAAEISKTTSGSCVAAPGDAGDVGVVREMVEQAVAQFGRLDIAVANAGLTLWSDFFDYRSEDFERVVGVNLRGSYFLAQAAARQMRAQLMRRQGNGGRILFMSSVTGHQAIRYLSAYAMTKAALEMLARSLVVELSPYGITVNCVAPGATITPRNLADDPNYEAIWAKVTPMQRPASTLDIANAALFLLSPAAGQITGQTIIVDGGWTAVSPTPALDFVETAGDD